MKSETRQERRLARWTDQQSKAIFLVVYFLVGTLIRLLLRRFQILGREHIPANGGAFIVANHTSYTDPFLLGYAIYNVRHRILRGPGKAQLFANPVLAWIMRKLGIFPLQQGVADAAGVRTMVDLYRQGKLVAVFPEGGRSRDGKLQPFVPDFTRLVIKLRVPVIPAGMAGPYDVLPMGATVLRRGVSVAVAFGEPVDLSDFQGVKLTPEVLEGATARLRDAVAVQVARAEEARGATDPFPAR